MGFCVPRDTLWLTLAESHNHQEPAQEESRQEWAEESFMGLGWTRVGAGCLRPNGRGQGEREWKNIHAEDQWGSCPNEGVDCVWDNLWKQVERKPSQRRKLWKPFKGKGTKPQNKMPSGVLLVPRMEPMIQGIGDPLSQAGFPGSGCWDGVGGRGVFGRDQALWKEGGGGEQDWTEQGVELKCKPDRLSQPGGESWGMRHVQDSVLPGAKMARSL